MLGVDFYSILEFTWSTNCSFDIFRNMTGIFFLIQGYLQFSLKLCHIVCARCPAFHGMTLPIGIVDPKLDGQSCNLNVIGRAF